MNSAEVANWNSCWNCGGKFEDAATLFRHRQQGCAQVPPEPQTEATPRLSDHDLRRKVSQLNNLLHEIQSYKTAYPEQRLGYWEQSIGSILNAYREGDLTFDETIAAVKNCNSHDSLQRRVEELTDENGSLQRVCKANINAALELSARVEQLEKALRRCEYDFDVLITRGDITEEPRAHATLRIIRAALKPTEGS